MRNFPLWRNMNIHTWTREYCRKLEESAGNCAELRKTQKKLEKSFGEPVPSGVHVCKLQWAMNTPPCSVNDGASGNGVGRSLGIFSAKISFFYRFHREGCNEYQMKIQKFNCASNESGPTKNQYVCDRLCTFWDGRTDRDLLF